MFKIYAMNLASYDAIKLHSYDPRIDKEWVQRRLEPCHMANVR